MPAAVAGLLVSSVQEVDFEQKGWEKALLEAGYDPKKPGLWVAEGLVFYLSDASVRGIFSTVQRLSPAGSLASRFGFQIFEI